MPERLTPAHLRGSSGVRGLFCTRGTAHSRYALVVMRIKLDENLPGVGRCACVGPATSEGDSAATRVVSCRAPSRCDPLHTAAVLSLVSITLWGEMRTHDLPLCWD